MNKEEIPRLHRGSKENPITNIFDLSNAMIGRKNTIIYIKGNFELNEKILFEINVRNIELKNVGDSNECRRI